MITRRFRNMITNELKNDSNIIAMIDMMLHMLFLQFESYREQRISAHDFAITVQNAYDALNNRLYEQCMYHNVYNDIYEQYDIVFRFNDISDLAFDIIYDLLDEFIDTVNDYMLSTNYEYYFERHDDEIAMIKQYMICERYRKSIKATYNLDAYINQYIDFYSNI